MLKFCFCLFLSELIHKRKCTKTYFSGILSSLGQAGLNLNINLETKCKIGEMIQCLNSQKQHYLHLTFEMSLMLQVAIATGTPMKLFTTAKAIKLILCTTSSK